jgi:hypothetical protein
LEIRLVFTLERCDREETPDLIWKWLEKAFSSYILALLDRNTKSCYDVRSHRKKKDTPAIFPFYSLKGLFTCGQIGDHYLLSSNSGASFPALSYERGGDSRFRKKVREVQIRVRGFRLSLTSTLLLPEGSYAFGLPTAE